MVKKILYLQKEQRNETIKTLSDVGSNYGNLCFYYGTINIFKDHEIYYKNHTNNSDFNPDFIVVTVANALCNVDMHINYLRHLDNIMKKYKCKKILLSIGAQNENLQMFIFDEDKKKVIKSFFDNFDFINLRGMYTRDLLKYNNINYDYKILGCPTIYLCKPINVNKITINNKTNILFNGPSVSMNNKTLQKNTQPNCKFIFELIKDLSLDFLYQTNYSPYFLKNKKNIIIPNNYDNWKKIIKNYDFVIGTRIHGALMALICNIPTLLIVIDSRTYELAEIFKIPYINIIDKGIDLKNKSDVVKLINSYTFNFNNYNNYIDEYKKNIKLKLLEPFDLLVSK